MDVQRDDMMIKNWGFGTRDFNLSFGTVILVARCLRGVV